MKNLKTTIAMLAITSIAIFFSCKKTTTPDPAPSSGGSVTATIGTLTFQSSTATITKPTGTLNTISIIGIQANGSNISIQITGYTPSVGTYKLYDTGPNANYTAYALYGAIPVGTTQKNYTSIGCDVSLPRAGFVPSGTVTFTEVSATKVAGNFQFNAAQLNDCADVKLITAGSFTRTF